MRRAPDVRPEVPQWSGAPAGLRSAFLLQHEPHSVSPVPASAPGLFLPARASAAWVVFSARAGLPLQAFPAAVSARLAPAPFPVSRARAAATRRPAASPAPAPDPSASAAAKTMPEPCPP